MESSKTEKLNQKNFECDVSGISGYAKGVKCQPSWNDIICKYLDYI